MALIVLDASVVIAHRTGGDAHHRAAVAALLKHAGDDLRLPASAYAESQVGPVRQGLAAQSRNDLQTLVIAIEPLTEPIAERAAELRAVNPTLRLPDALVIATGDILRADAILTADRSWQRFGSRIQVM